ncbi:MFS transporter [Pseudonocardia sp. H11422]|uniref:MFS transporter n=1 Tax=Pseudonocardia sp. H11422 TaxID=2835866 RepID=UPI0027E225F3|nr:MFS transporter [Pseudonocardia sp. H11422]
MSVSLADYRAAVRAPGAAVPVLASAVGRLPIAMFGLATLLYVQRETGSFAMAGLVSAGSLAGVSVGSVIQGRVMDRVGPTRPLLLVAGVFALAVAGLVLAIEAGHPLAVLVPAAVAAGLSMPAMPGASRALWADLVPPGPRRDAAYSYEAISLEVFFILGPALAAFLVTAPWPGTGAVAAAAAMVAGSVGFALSAPVRAQRPAPQDPEAPRTGLLGALARPGMRTVALASLGFGLVVGAVEVGVPAVTAAAGSAALGGVLLSAWSVTSVLAGVLYGMRPWPRPLHLRMPVLLAGFGALVVTMALTGPTGSLLVLLLAMLAAGALITPQVTAHSMAVDLVAPTGTATEAFGWVVTAATLGLAAGQSIAGVVVEAAGPPAAFVAGGAAGLVLAGVLWVRRRTLAEAPPAPALATA